VWIVLRGSSHVCSGVRYWSDQCDVRGRDRYFDLGNCWEIGHLPLGTTKNALGAIIHSDNRIVRRYANYHGIIPGSLLLDRDIASIRRKSPLVTLLTVQDPQQIDSLSNTIPWLVKVKIALSRAPSHCDTIKRNTVVTLTLLTTLASSITNAGNRLIRWNMLLYYEGSSFCTLQSHCIQEMQCLNIFGRASLNFRTFLCSSHELSTMCDTEIFR
jgi:hypothetical protein